MRCKVMYKDSLTQVYHGDSLQILMNGPKKPTEDIITFTVDTDEQIIYARITKPSQHTKYLISQGRCCMTINCYNFRGHGPKGYHFDWQNTGWAHSSGLGRGSYHFHKHWSLCLNRYSLLDSDTVIKVTDVDDVIEIPYHYQPSYNSRYWNAANVKGYESLARYSAQYSNPSREQWQFTIKIALLSGPELNQWNSVLMRPYAMSQRTAVLAFENED